jgi:uncharacterized caspase-like protein
MASHGINKDGEFFLLPYDGDFDNPSNTMISWADIGEVLGNLPAKVLLFLDACHSGQLGQNVNAAGSVDNTEALRDLSSDENGVVIMSAATGNETAQEREDWGHGAFTLSLIEGLAQGKADIKDDRIIFLRELDFYVSERTNELTNGMQHPTTQKPSSISRLPVFKVN